MMMVAPRPLLIISSEIEYKQHDILPKCLETIKVYAGWQDAKGSGLPSALAASSGITNVGSTTNLMGNRMKPINAKSLDRKSGGSIVDRSAVFPLGDRPLILLRN